jgi:hypothetical protein
MNKVINNGYIIAVSTGNTGEQITETEYNEILSAMQSAPTAPDGYTYKLKADTLTWELVELPPIDDTDDEATESDYITALQDLGVEVN